MDARHLASRIVRSLFPIEDFNRTVRRGLLYLAFSCKYYAQRMIVAIHYGEMARSAENFFQTGCIRWKTVDESSCNIWHESSVFDVLMDESFDGTYPFVHRRERDGFVPPVTVFPDSGIFVPIFDPFRFVELTSPPCFELLHTVIHKTVLLKILRTLLISDILHLCVANRTIFQPFEAQTSKFP